MDGSRLVKSDDLLLVRGQTALDCEASISSLPRAVKVDHLLPIDFEHEGRDAGKPYGRCQRHNPRLRIREFTEGVTRVRRHEGQLQQQPPLSVSSPSQFLVHHPVNCQSAEHQEVHDTTYRPRNRSSRPQTQHRQQDREDHVNDAFVRREYPFGVPHCERETKQRR